MVQSAGSLATHFFAEAGLGKVHLTWETDEEDFEDLLGYNIIRYTEHVDSIYETDFDKYGDWEQHLIIKGDTTLINETLIDSRDQSFTDYNVVPGTTYYYQIKQMTTSLTSHDLSNVVAATPLTASKGDANGSMSVDVADVVTEVAYMTYQDPQPFIFETADVITDSIINVLDVVGTVNIIKNPTSVSASSVGSSAVYTIEDGILYVDSDVALGGVQFRFNVGEGDEIIALEALDGFETVSDNQGDKGYLFFAFSMSGKVLPIGKQALLQIGNAEIIEVVLSDATGKNVVAIDGKATGLGTIEAMQMVLPYPNPFDEVLTVPYKIGKDGRHDVKIVVSTIAGSRVAEHNVSAEYGEYSWNWYAGESVQAGVYFVSLYVDDKLMQTAKVVKK
ncbi:MAG: T9SS type A sorting domain-containing protein [Bacteroidaceae bacterium]|nr:T9SS type A sorting domain-containing protein [Bacteroidaceae bacterium]